MKNPAGVAVYGANAVYVGVVINHHHIIQGLQGEGFVHPVQLLLPITIVPST